MPSEERNCRNCWWLQECPLCEKCHCGEGEHEVKDPDKERCDGFEVDA